MKIAKNNINLRIANEKEEKIGKELLMSAEMIGSQHILVSEDAFDGYLSFYMGVENKLGEIDSCGWIGKL